MLIRPTERHELPALKAAGFTGYLVKPVRAASLAARLRAEDAFEHALAEAVDESNEACTRRRAGNGKGLSILVAEDNEINALLARALLVRLGHRPTIAGNGEAAVESWAAARAAGTPYDLVLMDVQMPGMDGLEAARRIRAAEAAAGDRPARIVALTANAYRRRPRGLRSPPAWTVCWSSRWTASGCARRSRRVGAARLRPDRGVPPHCHKSVSGPCCRHRRDPIFDSLVLKFLPISSN